MPSGGGIHSITAKSVDGAYGEAPARTTARISIPIVTPIRRRHPNRARRADLPHRGAGLLEENGFGVVEAANADAALKLLETRDDVRLLFTDIQCRLDMTVWT
jgi:hypothetical protein